MDELVVKSAKKIDENTPIPKITEDNIFELFQLQTVADLRLMSRNFMRLSLFLDDIYGKFENKYVKNTDLATDTEAGILTLNKVREIAPQPDLSPYLRYDKTFIDKGDNINSGQDFVIRCNRSDIWTPRHLNMYSDDNPNTYQGTFHLNGGRAYYKVPNRNGGNWCEIMDNHDMAARDNRMNQMDADRNNVRNLAQDARNVAGVAWNKANDAQLNRVANMRLTSLISIPVWYGQTYERVGYVVTGFNNADGDIGGGDHMYMRCLQLQFGHGGWVTVWE